MPYKVFISYSTRDIRIAELIKNILENNFPSVKVFLAEYSIKSGEPLSDKIFNAIKDCDLFILLWSKNSKNSDWVKSEIGAAKGCEKPILPIVLDREAEKTLPPFIKDIKYIQAYSDFKRAIYELCQIVGKNSQHEDEDLSGLLLLGIGAAIMYLLFKDQ